MKKGSRAKNATRRIIHIAYFTALTAVGAFIRIPIGEVAFSMQSFFVIMAGLIIGAVDGCIAQAAYMIIGLIGIPIFTQGGGFSYVLKPSFGYILGFCAGAFVSGAMLKLLGNNRTFKIWTAAICGLIPMYAIGCAYQYMILVVVTKLSAAAAAVSLVSIALFFVFDLVALFLVSLVYPRLAKAIGSPAGAIKRRDDEANSEPPLPESAPADPKVESTDSIDENSDNTDENADKSTDSADETAHGE